MTEQAAPGLGSDPRPYLSSLGRSSFSAGLIFLDEQARLDLRVFYAYCRAVDDCADDFSREESAEFLGQWRRSLGSLSKLEAASPLGSALAGFCRRRKVPLELLRALVTGARSDLRPKVRFANRAQLSSYCHQVAGVVGEACLPLFGVEIKKGKAFAEHLGRGFQLINIIRDLGEDARRGRLYLALSDLKRHRVTERDVLALKSSPGLEATLAEYAVWAETCLAEAGHAAKRAGLDPKALRPALLMRELYHALLKKMRRHRFNVLEKRYRLNLGQKALISGKCWLRGVSLEPGIDRG